MVFEKGSPAFPGAARRYRSVLTRADGVQVVLEGGSWNRVGGGGVGEVPHDIAHLVIEAELGLSRGVWGVLAAGGLFGGATILGRSKPHAAKRGAEILAASVEELNQAEVLVRAVCDFAIRGDTDLGALRRHAGARYWRDGITREAVARCFTRLHDDAAVWAALPPDGTLTRTWPAR